MGLGRMCQSWFLSLWKGREKEKKERNNKTESRGKNRAKLTIRLMALGSVICTPDPNSTRKHATKASGVLSIGPASLPCAGGGMELHLDKSRSKDWMISAACVLDQLGHADLHALSLAVVTRQGRAFVGVFEGQG